MKLVKRIVKKVTKDYFDGFARLYEPCIKAGIYPFI